MELRVAVRIFDDREQKHLSHIMALSSKRGDVPMLTVPASSADVIFIKRDEPGAAVFLQPGRRGKLPIAVLYDDVPAGHDWFLPRPATSAGLIPLLQALKAEVDVMAVSRSAEPAPVDVPAAVIDPRLLQAETRIVPTITGQSLLERLKLASDAGGIYSVQLDVNSYLIIDGDRKVVHIPLRFQDMQQTLLDILVMFRDSDYVALSVEDRDRLLALSPTIALALEQFTWSACHHAEPQLPIPEHIIHQAFRLKRWPSFTRLRYKPVHMQWAGRLVKTAHSMSHLATDAMTDMIDAAKFYNACVVGGLALVEAGSGVPLPAMAAEAGGKRGIMQRILKRLMK